MMLELKAWEDFSVGFLFVIKLAATFNKLEAFNANL